MDNVVQLHRPIKLISRQNVDWEIAIMKQLAAKLAAHSRRVREVFCDSKACSVYSVRVDGNTSKDEAQLIARIMEAGLIWLNCGYNSIDVCRDDGEVLVFLNPDWLGDYFYLDDDDQSVISEP